VGCNNSYVRTEGLFNVTDNQLDLSLSRGSILKKARTYSYYRK